MSISSNLDLSLQHGGYSKAQAEATVDLSAQGNLKAVGHGIVITIAKEGKYQAKLQERITKFSFH